LSHKNLAKENAGTKKSFRRFCFAEILERRRRFPNAVLLAVMLRSDGGA
jgi:hypothetical protein